MCLCRLRVCVGVMAMVSFLSPYVCARSHAKGDQNAQNITVQTTTDSGKVIYPWLKTYSETVGLVEKRAYRTVDFSKFIQNSLKAAVSEVDAHSAFLTSESYKAAMETTSGEFSGIGVSIITKTPSDDALVIIDVIPGGPAEKVGLKSGDKVVEVNGKKLKGLSTDEAVNELKGKLGTTVTIKIIRNKKPMEFTVKRDIIKDQNSLCYVFKTHHVHYLSLKMFTENAANNVADLLRIANQGTCDGIILDLRRNPGGTLQSAIEMSGLFLNKKSLVAQTKDRDRRVVDTYYTTTDPVLKTDVPVFILIDNFTASAAEILAGSLRYHSIKSYQQEDGKKKQRTILVFLLGTPTFGKGSVQEVIPMSNGCAMKLTTMLYYLPDDLSIQAKGITPDFLVKPRLVPVDELKWVTEMYGKETSLKGHITAKEASGQSAAEPAAKAAEAKASPTEDIEAVDDVSFDSEEAAMQKDEDDEPADKPDKGGEGEKKQQDTSQKWEKRQIKELQKDVQVQAAVNMIKLIVFAKKADPKQVESRDKVLDFLKQHYMTDDKVEIEKMK